MSRRAPSPLRGRQAMVGRRLPSVQLLTASVLACVFRTASATAGCSPSEGEACRLAEPEEPLRHALRTTPRRPHSLFARTQRIVRNGTGLSDAEPPSAEPGTCVPLTNMGSHFTVDVEIGTPAQGNFSIIVDTGSNSLIVQSCSCGQSGHCEVDQVTQCFAGTGRSSSFSIYSDKGEVKPEDGQLPDNLMMVETVFGSGTIIGLVAKDIVKVGSIRTMMDDGFLLMVDQSLNMPGPTLEGILGLGLPSSKTLMPSIINSSNRTNGTRSLGEANTSNSTNKAAADSTLPTGTGAQDISKALQAGSTEAAIFESIEGPTVKSFLEQAHINRFSLCFNDGAGGALRLGTSPAKNPLGSYGNVHWGLGVVGISVTDIGGASVPLAVDLCSPSSMRPGQETPCGAIPDSGTTMIAGPKSHLIVIQATLCDAWPLCRAKFAEEDYVPAGALIHPGTAQQIVKSELFEALLLDCASWLNSTEENAADMPTLQFEVTGKGGGRQIVRFPWRSYFFETEKESVKTEYMDVPFLGKVPVAERIEKKLVCVPAFMPMEYPTQLNGPVFILGLPLFLEYTVHYDSGSEPPSIALTSLQDEPCNACGDSSTGAGLAQTAAGRAAGRQHPWQVKGPVMHPRVDTTQPF